MHSSHENRLYLPFLKKLSQIAERNALRLQNEPLDDYFSYLAISKFHLFWLTFQLKAIHLLFSRNFPVQAAELARSIWEAKVNLMYIGRKPKERSRAFAHHFLKDLYSLKQQADKGNPYLPRAFKNFVFPKRTKELVDNHWEKQLLQRAKDIGLEEYYRSIYKMLSWHTHPEMFALISHKKVNTDRLDPYELQPLTTPILMITLKETWETLKELNKVLNMLTPYRIKRIEAELNRLVKLRFENKKAFVEKDLPALIQTFNQKVLTKIENREAKIC